MGSKTVALVDHQANDPKSTFNYVVDGASWTIGRAAELGVDVADYGNRFFSGFSQDAADLFSTGADIVTQLSDEDSPLRQDISQSIDENMTSMAECWQGVCDSISNTTGTVFDSGLSLLTFTGQVLVSSGKVLASIDTGNSILEFLHENFPDEPWPKDDAGNLIPAENFKIEDWTKITNWCANILDTIEPANYLAGEPMNDFVQEALESDPFQQSVLKTVVGQGFEQDVTKFVNSDQCESFKAYYDGVKQELEHIISNLEGDDEPVTFKNNDGEDTPLTF